MLSTLLKRGAARLSTASQQELKRLHFRRDLRRGRFSSDEPEWLRSQEWLRPGDWAVDVGANIGHYTKRFSDLVGPQGRVIAFEPVPRTFELLAANAAMFGHANVTLLNMAASTQCGIVSMSIPAFDTGLTNYYQAAISAGASGLQVMTCPLDALDLPPKVRLIKIDAEGHDMEVLRGAMQLLRQCRPVIVIESDSAEVQALLAPLDYRMQRQQGSSNAVYAAAAA